MRLKHSQRLRRPTFSYGRRVSPCCECDSGPRRRTCHCRGGGVGYPDERSILWFPVLRQRVSHLDGDEGGADKNVDAGPFRVVVDHRLFTSSPTEPAAASKMRSRTW